MFIKIAPFEAVPEDYRQIFSRRAELAITGATAAMTFILLE
jgi:hypothetical protein